MEGSPPETAQDLRDWFRQLKEESGLSYAEIARAIDEEERNVKRWMTGPKPVLPRGDVVLRLLSTLGVKFEPPLPGAVRGLSAQIESVKELLELSSQLLERQAVREEGEAEDAGSTADLAGRLLALEAVVDGQGRDTTKALQGVAAALRKLERRLEQPASDATRTQAAQ